MRSSHLLLLATPLLILALGPAPAASADKPNFLWIVSEDNSPLLGCYGDEYATTPNLDALAARSLVYDNAFATAPVCAAARSTLITGVYACSLGTENMRSQYRRPENFRLYPEYLKEAGYFCGNHSKTDYNLANVTPKLWNASGRFKGFETLADKQPFFNIINIGTSHESSMHKNRGKLRHDPAQVKIPPYHPDTPEMRRGWAQYYDVLEDLDSQIGGYLAQLEKAGLADDTIVFYYSDHGGTLARSKRFLYDSGTRVPLMIYVPPKFRHLVKQKMGTRTDRLVTFIDLPPTVFSLAGIDIPEQFQGTAFLGPAAAEPREYAFMHRARMDERYDLSRSLRDKRFRYTRNYMPHRIYGMHLEYLWRAEPTRVWEREYKAGHCNKAQSAFWERKPYEELYDVEADPDEVKNLADDPQYADVLNRMRNAMDAYQRKIRDAGFIPEGLVSDISQKQPPYRWKMDETHYPFERVLEMAKLAAEGKTQNLSRLRQGLKDANATIRFWAAMGAVNLGKEAKPLKKELEALLEDDVPDVRVNAAEALARSGETETGVRALIKEVPGTNQWAAVRALNALDELGEAARPVIPQLKEVLASQQKNKYIPRTANNILNELLGTSNRVR
jgi:arylsulfatase A-like enzyme